MSRWLAVVTYEDKEGNSHKVRQEYDQEKRPDRTRVILDMVPRGCTTTSTSVTKAKN